MISATILGRLGKDAKVVKGKDGNPFLSFPLATDSGFGNERKTMWVSCIYTSRNAEKLTEFLKTGKQVVVSGRLNADIYTSSKNGKTTTGVDLKLNVRSLEFAGKAEEGKEIPQSPELPDVKQEELEETETAPF